MDERLAIALNNQLTFERFSAEVYYALATKLEKLNLDGMAHWMHKQAEEERSHAKKFSDYLSDRNVLAIIEGLDKPPMSEVSGVMDAGESLFRQAYGHEKVVTDRINALYSIAEAVDDPPTCVFLHWFITEQVEEVHTLEVLLTKFEIARGNGAAILALDHELGGR